MQHATNGSATKTNGRPTTKWRKGAARRRIVFTDPYKGKASFESSEYDMPAGGKGGPKLGRYWVEKVVGFMALALMLAAGVRLAIQSGMGDRIMIAGQIAGFTASTIFIARLKYQLSKGAYEGRQRRMGEGMFYGGVVLEGATLAAKFFPIIIPGYLALMVFSIPGLVIASFNIVYNDPGRRLRTLRNENKAREEMLAQKRVLVQVKEQQLEELSGLDSKIRMLEMKADARVKQAGKSKGRIKNVARVENNNFVTLLEKDAGVKNRRTKRLERKEKAKEVKAIDVTPKKRRTRQGPANDPENDNAPRCKNPKCRELLTGNQKVSCGRSTCRSAISRLVNAGKLKKTW